MIELRTMTREEIADFLPGMLEGYIADWARAGEDPGVARTRGEQQFAMLFPDGLPAEGNEIFYAMREGERAGVLWMGPAMGGATGVSYVFFVEVDERLRGQGLGREIMLAAEQWAREQGSAKIGLNVFGFNDVARGLYESLGYTPVAIQMHKPLD